MQFDMFADNSPQGLMQQQIDEIRASKGKIQRCMFARLNQQLKMIVKQQAEIQKLKHRIEGMNHEEPILWQVYA